MRQFKKFNISKGLIIKDNKVLLIKRAKSPYKGKWSLPGGKLENNEFAKTACIREIKEEINLETEKMRLIGIINEFLTEAKSSYQFIIWVYEIGPFVFIKKKYQDRLNSEIKFFEIKKFLHSRENKFNVVDRFFTQLFLSKKTNTNLILELKTKLEKNKHIIKEKLLYY